MAEQRSLEPSLNVEQGAGTAAQKRGGRHRDDFQEAE
jgi:hypothetical protein